MTNTYTLEKKALSAKAIKKIKLGDQAKADIGEHITLRVSCAKTGSKFLLPIS